MQCFNCHEEVDKVITVYKQMYDQEGLDAGIVNSYWCLRCIQNTDENRDESVNV